MVGKQRILGSEKKQEEYTTDMKGEKLLTYFLFSGGGGVLWLSRGLGKWNELVLIFFLLQQASKKISLLLSPR